MPGRLSSRVFVGRSTEVAELRAAYERAAGGQPRPRSWSGGRPASARRRLLGELAPWARDAGARVLMGQCADLQDAAIPLLPIADALGALAERDGRGPASASAMEPPPELIAVGRGAAPGRRRVHASPRGACARLSLTAPVVLALEDVHWADRSDARPAHVPRRADLRDERPLPGGRHLSQRRDRPAPRRCDGFVAEAAPAGRASSASSWTRLTPGRGARPSSKGILEEQPGAAVRRGDLRPLGGQPALHRGASCRRRGEGGRRGLPESLRDMLLARIRTASKPCGPGRRGADRRGRWPARASRATGAGAAVLDEAQLTAEPSARPCASTSGGRRTTASPFRHPLLQGGGVRRARARRGRPGLHAACATRARGPARAGRTARARP